VKPTLRFRLWGKKRGDRSTGSPLAGSLGEAVFFGTLFLLGIIAVTALITSQIMDPTPELYRPGFGFWLMVLVMASFVVIGGIGVVLTVAEAGASAERRSAIVRRAADMEIIREALPSPQEYPNVPRDARLTDSPGVYLAFRLPTGRRSAWTLATTSALSLLLSGFAAVLTVLFLQKWLVGRPDWFVFAFALPFLITGSWTVRHCLLAVLRHSRTGSSFIEISDLPLRPGNNYDVFLSQTGRLRLQSLSFFLVNEEEATYHQGTDVRTETRVVYEHPIFCREEVEVAPGNPLDVEEILSVPTGAMHSFQSAHNAIRWKLVVRGVPVHGAPFERTFPILLYPDLHEKDTQAARVVDSFAAHHGTAH